MSSPPLGMFTILWHMFRLILTFLFFLTFRLILYFLPHWPFHYLTVLLGDRICKLRCGSIDLFIFYYFTFNFRVQTLFHICSNLPYVLENITIANSWVLVKGLYIPPFIYRGLYISDKCVIMYKSSISLVKSRIHLLSFLWPFS